MSDRPDKQSRKTQLQAWRAQQRAAARAKLPLPDEQMQAMFDMLDWALPDRGCDHTLRMVREWAEEAGLSFDAVAAWCLENGGNCDCEVLANCEECWQDAKRDVNQ
ncbi:DUF2695 domain-containing protein [Anatilimnocola sp. NA78]|uniref:DUF2695 domain-containing protein n=1 Tax=Anatilimnocola sp. NA78 TaxID=3415683 RepID=UPI003CE4DE59